MNRRGILRWTVVGCLLALSAPRAEDQPKKVDIKNLSCQDFMALPDDVRPVVVAWVHGYTRAGGENWVFQAGEGKAFVDSVEEKCTKAPRASFRYQVTETAKERQAARKAAAKK
jgi:HdeA/HdeB family